MPPTADVGVLRGDACIDEEVFVNCSPSAPTNVESEYELLLMLLLLVLLLLEEVFLLKASLK
jgi:hypothetical protein